jgi:hypothetical protein
MLQIANARVAARSCLRALGHPRCRLRPLTQHLKASYRWICKAQDATPDGGVSGCYNLLYGWAGSYPETTGYIIPTFLHYSDAIGDPDARARAIRMANWEIEVQLPTGAVRSGMLGTKVGPAVFNTGQVLFGWISAIAATNDPNFTNAATKAARWLISVQDTDGAWRKYLSMLSTSSVQTYNVRAAWGLAIAGVELDEKDWKSAALRNCEWALSQQTPNGWFARNAFSDQEQPLLHTIGYVLEGLLGVGELLGCERYIHATRSGIAPLVELFQRTGTLRGRYDPQWTPAASWRCLTGEAQIAIVLQRLTRITGERAYSEMAQRLIDGLASTQDMNERYPESFGGIAGSQPLWGGYAPFNYLNWAAKFFMDALLLNLFVVDVQESPGNRRLVIEERAV